MSTQPKAPLLTPDEYLAIERGAGFKSEYVDGMMYQMTGAKYWHVQVVSNLTIEIGLQLKGRTCSVLSNGIKVRMPDSRKFFYSGVTVVCGEPHFHDERTDIVLNPVLLIEVLSKSTESFDWGDKFQADQTLEFLREYVLAAQVKPAVEQYVRQSDETWTYRAAIGRDSSLLLPSIECMLDLNTVYDKVDWKEYERSSNNDE